MILLLRVDQALTSGECEENRLVAYFPEVSKEVGLLLESLRTGCSRHRCKVAESAKTSRRTHSNAFLHSIKRRRLSLHRRHAVVASPAADLQSRRTNCSFDFVFRGERPAWEMRDVFVVRLGFAILRRQPHTRHDQFNRCGSRHWEFLQHRFIIVDILVDRVFHGKAQRCVTLEAVPRYHAIGRLH